MSFLTILQTIGTYTRRAVHAAVALEPLVVAVAPPAIGAEYTAAVNIIIALETMVPLGSGPAKEALAIPAIQKLFPDATVESIKTLNSDIVASFNKFAAVNTKTPSQGT